MSIKDELIKKYSRNSKHSNYQVLSSKLQDIIELGEVETRTRFEVERLAYIIKKIQIQGKTILDIGGNTGFFSFEMLERGAKNVHYFEGNKEHAEFVKLATEYLKVEDKMKITNAYFPFDGSLNDIYDIILLFNVLHHLGDDYGDKKITIEEVKRKIAQQINSLSHNTDILVFQMGFNWKGDVGQCLFNNGTKKEMIEFLKNAVATNWDILDIGIAEKNNEVVKYVDLNEGNVERNDALGEFLNRPIFVLKSRRVRNKMV